MAGRSYWGETFFYFTGAIIPIGPARSCPWPPRLAWQAGELAMAGGAKSLNFD